MNTYKSTAIIFKTLKYRDSSLIVDAFTRERGLRSYIVNGVRSARKGNNAGLYQVTNIVDLVAYEKAENSLSRIKEIKLHRLYMELSRDIIKSSIATMIIEVARNAIKEHEAHVELYDFLENQLLTLDAGDHDLSLYPIRFMCGLAHHLGIAPSNDYSPYHDQFDLVEGVYVAHGTSSNRCLAIDESAYLSRLLQDEAHLKIPKSIRNSLLQNMANYFQYHLPSFAPLKSLSILSTVLS